MAVAGGLLARAQDAQPRFRKTTVESILGMGKRIDGKPVELHGRLISGPETSVFMDASTCKGLHPGVSGCSIWALLRDCRVDGDEPAREPCSRVVGELSRPQPQSAQGVPTLFVLDNVTLRGIALTVRRDIKYARSVPKSVRVGFGHLSAYPAEIEVRVLSIGPNQ
jgi:hypothetical protein